MVFIFWYWVLPSLKGEDFILKILDIRKDEETEEKNIKKEEILKEYESTSTESKRFIKVMVVLAIFLFAIVVSLLWPLNIIIKIIKLILGGIG